MIQPLVKLRWRTDGQQAELGDVAIVADVLRASTTLTTAFAMGAARACVTTDIAEARRIARDTGGLLIGERHNRAIVGFDYGNSPLELEPGRMVGATIVLSSTNFPHGFAAAASAGRVLVGALVNLSAVCHRAVQLAQGSGSDITLLLSGEPSEGHALEDHYFGARAAAFLSGAFRLDHAAQWAVTNLADRDTKDIMSASIHARELTQAGFSGDVDFAFAIDTYEVVGEFDGRWITHNGAT